MSKKEIKNAINPPVDEAIEDVKEEIAIETEPVIKETSKENKHVKIKDQFSNFKVNIRKSASLSADIVDQITKDDVVEIISGSLNKKWIEVSKGSITGFVMSEYLEKSE